jgi:hypothetical protein
VKQIELVADTNNSPGWKRGSDSWERGRRSRWLRDLFIRVDIESSRLALISKEKVRQLENAGRSQT